MASVKIKRVQGDTAPDWEFSLARPDGSVPDLSGATVKFIIESPTGTVTNTDHQECTVTDEAAGEGYYQFVDGDLSEDGTYTCDLEITYANGEVETAPQPIQIVARPQAG